MDKYQNPPFHHATHFHHFPPLLRHTGPSYFLNAIVALYAVVNGYMDDVKLQYSKLYEYMLVNKDLPVNPSHHADASKRHSIAHLSRHHKSL